MAHILVVDDDPVINRVLKAYLENANHTVSISENGREAWQLLVKQTPQHAIHLVISDINMPEGISGFNLISMIRKSEEMKSIPIILISGLREKSSVIRAIQEGADDYIVKPIDTDILLAKVESLLEKNPSSFAFADIPVLESADAHIEIKICSLSEQGVKLIFPIALRENTKLTISSDLFERIGMPSPPVRISTCVPHEGGGYWVSADFIGLDIKEFHLIRKFLMTLQPLIYKKAE